MTQQKEDTVKRDQLRNYKGFTSKSDHGGIQREVFVGKASDGSVAVRFETLWPGDPEPTLTEFSLTHHAAGMLASCLFNLLHNRPNADAEPQNHQSPDA